MTILILGGCTWFKSPKRGRRHRDRIVVDFTTTYAIGAYRHGCCGFDSRSERDVLDTTLCDQVCQGLAAGRWFSPDRPPIKLTATI